MTHDNIDILVVDDDISHCTILQALLRGWGYNVALANSGRQALEQVRERVFDLVLCDVRMAEMDGIATLKEIKALNPAIPVLIMTAYSSVETAVEALKTGALDYLIKPLDFDNLQATLEKALAHTHSIDAETPAVTASQFGMVGKSPAMQHLLSEIALVAPSEATVLIHGDSGTGKELVARAIHASSARSEKPLVTLNCAALNESLLESELFGHEKGAFTGADKRREGRFVEADGGTLFLDEIGDISPMMQVRLLRAIQEREVQRVGSNQTISVDVRLIAATHRDLAAEVNAGRFRQDLYYRLNVVAIEVPSLRQRREDIPLLAGHFLQRFAERNRKAVKGFTPQAMDLLIHYDWPGNIRERGKRGGTGSGAADRGIYFRTRAAAGDCQYADPAGTKSGYSAVGGSGKRGDSGGAGENGRQQNRSRPSVRDHAQNAIGKTVALVLLAFDGAPADIFPAEAVVPVNIGH